MLFKLLLLIHVASAIFGLGPGFAFIPIKQSAKTLEQLRFAYAANGLLHRFVMIGGFLLLLTGLLMGSFNHALFHQGWYVTSLIIYLAALALGPFYLSPKVKPIHALLKDAKGPEIPEEYYEQHKAVLRGEWVLNGLFTLIIILMLTKPF
ncbi:DUF2269 family protein [Pullulanibacillus sp. KACC 23026]|uniref:DUF2269 family protein n=1 Tax=Pullulanibacillus sp. KACC 23026 TaxID=3028315 RepID=UPI0023AEB154|nr:DUF2269 family protein [Pullulanibacillus sp. KACC 23026]WEG11792.1 DUF2269 family protein [Pullulanibacillus sp. KACC 23026]